MDKIKSILRPGKSVEDEQLYGSAGRGTNPVLDRLSKDDQGSGLYSSATNPPKALESNMQGRPAQSDKTDNNAPQAEQEARAAGNATSPAPADAEVSSKANADLLATREADRRSPEGSVPSTSATTSGVLRPEYPPPASAGSTASVKSNVIGKTPTGSYVSPEQSDLPPIPVTEGKFLNSEEPVLIGSTKHQYASSIPHDVPLAEPSSTAAAQSTSPRHQSQLAKELDPNIDSNTSTTINSSNQDSGAASQSHSYGLDAVLAGAGASAYGVANGSDAENTQLSNTTTSDMTRAAAFPAGTTSSGLENAATETSASEMAVPTSSFPTQVGDANYRDDLKPRQMPGAYPETPMNESEKTLGAAGVGSSAAVLAAQKAYQKHEPSTSSEVQPTMKPSATQSVPPATILADPSPYNSNVDPRADPSHKATAAYTAAGAAAAGGVGLAASQIGHDENVKPQGTLRETIQQPGIEDDQRRSGPALAAATSAINEPKPQGSFSAKIQDAHAKDDNRHEQYAVAGATAAATGLGAYEFAKHHENEEAAYAPSNTQEFKAHTQTSHGFGANDSAAAGTSTAPGSLQPQPLTHQEAGREFPLADAHKDFSSSKPTNFSDLTIHKETTPAPGQTLESGQDRFPKDAAETGAAGAGGLAAYEALKRDHDGMTIGKHSTFDDPLSSSAHPRALEGYDDQRAVPSHHAHTVGHEPVTIQPESSRSDTDRDAKLAGATLLGGGALATHASGDGKLEQERAKVAERKHEEYEARRSSDKSRKSSDKTRHDGDGKEHKHGLIHRLLHRHKSREDLDDKESPRSSHDKSRASYEQPVSPVTPKSHQLSDELNDEHGNQSVDSSAVAHVGGGSPTTSSSGRHHHERNRLHKDPPPGLFENSH